MQVFLSWEADDFEYEIRSAIMAKDPDVLRQMGQAADHANLIWSSWLLARGGSVILLSAGYGLGAVEASHLQELPDIREQYGRDLQGRVSVGVGTTILEAYQALQTAQKTGGDKIIIFEEGLTDISPEDSEAQELSGTESWDDLSSVQKSEYRRQYRQDLETLQKLEYPLAAIRDGRQYQLLSPLSAVSSFDKTCALILAKNEVGENAVLDARELFIDGQPLIRPVPARHGVLVKADQPKHHIPSRPTPPAKPTTSGEHEEVQGAEKAAEVQQDAVPEQTHAGKDFLSQFKDLANGQQDQDNQEFHEDAGDPRDEVRQEVVKILKDVQGRSEQLNELREKNPEVYESVSNLVRVLITMGRELMRDQPGQGTKVEPTEKGELEPHESPPPEDSKVLDKDIEKAALPMPKASTRHELQLPVGTQKDSSPGGSHDAGKLKIRDSQSGQEKWRSVRAGLVLDPQGQPTSSRNPSGS